VRGELPTPAEPAQTYRVCGDCSEDIWAQLVNVEIEAFSSDPPHPLRFETSKECSPLEEGEHPGER
jgi:hypothetical protein